MYLMDRTGQYLGFFPAGTPPERMADVIRPLVERARRKRWYRRPSRLGFDQ
jgi:hypothetical protein